MTNNTLLFYINDSEVTYDTIRDWEHKRLTASKKLLSKNKTVKGSDTNPSEDKKMTSYSLADEVLNLKLKIGTKELTHFLSFRYNLGNFMSSCAATLSRGNRKFSSIEILVPHSHLTPQQVMAKIENIMLVNTTEHLKINLGSNPDHYVLQSVDPSVQEVLEFTGGSPLPTRFFAHYGEETGLKSKLSPGYTIQNPGVAKLPNGKIIGGMRHQVKQDRDGFRFKALVEFPSILPAFMIKQHQLHLACEFGHWVSAVLEEN